jgi:hypothetical protein
VRDPQVHRVRLCEPTLYRHESRCRISPARSVETTDVSRPHGRSEKADRVDADVVLIRSDGCVARALPAGQDLDVTSLVRAPGTWFGRPA